MEKNASTLADIFWNHWGSEYLSTLQKKEKIDDATNIQVGDVVLLREKELYRSNWPLVLELTLGRTDWFENFNCGPVRMENLAPGSSLDPSPK